MPATGKMGDSCLNAHRHISVQAEVFLRKERVGRTKRSRHGVVKFSTCRRAQSIPIRQVMVRCASSWFSHSGPWLKAIKSPGAGMPEGQSLCLVKLIPRILIQTCCLSTSYVPARASIYKKNVKRIVGWLTVPHYYRRCCDVLGREGVRPVQLTLEPTSHNPAPAGPVCPGLFLCSLSRTPS